MQVVSRAEWGAAPSRGTLVPLRGAKGTVIHWEGGYIPDQDHSHCASLVKSLQAGAFARTDATYVDIEYNMLVCQHGYAFVGRGIGVKPAAQSAANSEYFAVCALLGPAGEETPSPAMLGALDDVIADIQLTGPAGTEVLGHHDVPGNSTDCPGPALLELVHRGMPLLRTTTPEPAPRPDGGVVVVEPYPAVDSTLWGIAEHYLGNGERWHELATLNAAELHGSTQLEPGMKIQLPPE